MEKKRGLRGKNNVKSWRLLFNTLIAKKTNSREEKSQVKLSKGGKEWKS